MKLLHLYYDLLNLYGEYGNVVVLKKHLEDQGFRVKVDQKTIGEEIDFAAYDFIYCGSGTEKNQSVALKDLLKRKASLKKAIKQGTVILFTGNAMELLGQKIDEQKALALVDIETKTTDKRYTGDVVVKNDELGELVGFINKCSLISGEANELFTYVFKDNNLVDNDKEGYHFQNVYGTHIIGPILVKNPNFMKKIVCLLGERKKKDFSYKEVNYHFEVDSYQVTLTALKERIK